MKKVLAIILSLVLVFTLIVFVGCVPNAFGGQTEDGATQGGSDVQTGGAEICLRGNPICFPSRDVRKNFY